MKSIIYFDNAATTVNKPPSVIRAVSDALSNAGNPGRSAHVYALNAARAVYECRKSVARFFGSEHPEHVVFTSGATHALNLVIKGYAEKGCHIVYSNLEHNSVIRPVYALTKNEENGIRYSVYDATGSDENTLRAFKAALRPQTTIAIATLASNVCGKILPIAEMARVCKERGILLLCDASQGAGAMPVNAGLLGIDALCFAGHKSLYGPQGVGGVLFHTDKRPHTLLEGGNGLHSMKMDMDGDLPEVLEAGTVNTPGICGLDAGIAYVSRIGVEEIFERSEALGEKLCEKLGSVSGVTLYGANGKRLPTVLFNKKGVSAEQCAASLARERICVRGGLHCAPLAHEALGTGEDGAVRASLTFRNTEPEIDAFVRAVERL